MTPHVEKDITAHIVLFVTQGTIKTMQVLLSNAGLKQQFTVSSGLCETCDGDAITNSIALVLALAVLFLVLMFFMVGG